MAYEVTLPPLGEDASDTATVSQWLVAEGTAVQKGDDLVEMTTDKAAFNVPSPAAGTLTEIRAHENDEVSVGNVLCVIE
ncbi:MAG: lipoyl domain-containing protein [Candidatus Hydrogenedentota bacterium]